MLVGLADNDSSLVNVNTGGELVLKSGAITGNTHIGDDWVEGGSVSVYGATFTMEGGEISGNTVQGGRGVGDGVYIGGEGSVFTMKGGAITGNTVTGDEWAGGGGVRVSHNSTFTMEDGVISGNAAVGITDRGSGGGVCVSDAGSIFIMEDGEISGNTATGDNRGNGGGVRVGYDATFIMKGGVISGNTVDGSGGGVVMRIDDAVVIMEGGTIYGNAASLPAGIDASLANNAPTYSSLDGTGKWGTGGTYTKGGVRQTGGSEIVSGSGWRGTDDTLIAIPAR